LKGLERQHDLASIDPAKREILVADRMVKLMAFRSKAMRQLVRASRDMQLISRARHRQEPLVMVSASRRTPKDKLNASCRSAKRRMGADAPHRKRFLLENPLKDLKSYDQAALQYRCPSCAFIGEERRSIVFPSRLMR